MKPKIICGIQQVGIGVNDFVEAWKWYYDNFGFEIKIVDDEGVAERMLRSEEHTSELQSR